MNPLLPILAYGAAAAGLLWFASSPRSNGTSPRPRSNGQGTTAPGNGTGTTVPGTTAGLVPGDVLIFDLHASPTSASYTTPSGQPVRPSFVIGRYVHTYIEEEDPTRTPLAGFSIVGYTEDPNAPLTSAMPLLSGLAAAPVRDIVRQIPASTPPIPIANASGGPGSIAAVGDLVLIDRAAAGLGPPINPLGTPIASPFLLLEVRQANPADLIGSVKAVALNANDKYATAISAYDAGAPRATVVRVERAGRVVAAR